MIHTSRVLAIILLAVLITVPSIARTPDAAPSASPTTTTARYRSGIVIIKLKDHLPNRRDGLGFGVPSLDAILDRVGARSRAPLFPHAPWSIALPTSQGGGYQGFDRVYLLHYDTPIDAMALALELKGTGVLDFAEPYFIFDLAYTPNDPRFGEQYWFSLMQVQQAWDITKGDSAVVIGIVDSGLDWLHEDLGPNVWTNPGEAGMDGQNRDRRSNGIDDDGNGFVDDYHGWDLVGNPTLEQLQGGQLLPDNNPAPRVVSVSGYEGYHGTVVGGCASAATDNSKGIAGIGFNCSLLGVKCAADSVATGSIIAGYDGIRYAADAGARIINCSWGGNVDPAFVQSLQMVVDYAHSKGALVVAASGNGGTNNDVTPYYPCNLNRVVSVGATTSLDSAASFSQYGLSVDVWTAGVNTLSTVPNNGYQSNGLNGTSFSAPIISGLAGLIFSLHPNWTPDQVAMQLRVTGNRVKVSNPAWGPYFYRRANALRAVGVNRDLGDNNPENLPGIALVSYTVDAGSDDTIRSVDQTAIVNLRLKNYLAPGANVQVDALAGTALTIATPLTIASIGTLEERTEQLQVRINPDAPILYSEGSLSLILRLSSGNYEDLIAVEVPVRLPGWHRRGGITSINPLVPMLGSSISSPTPRVAFASAYQQTSQTTYRSAYARTVNGQDWSQFGPGNLSQTEPVYCIYALDNQKVWAGTGPSTGQAAVLRSTNGGGSWQTASVSTITPFVNAVHFFDAQNGIALGDPLNGIWGIALSTDGGASWSSPPASPSAGSASEAGWNNSYAVVGDSIWFGTNNGRIYRSTDRGLSWSWSPTGVNRNSLDIDFGNSLEGIACIRTAGGSGTRGLLITRDGGTTWTSATLPRSDAEPLGVAFVRGANRAYLTTQYGVFETRDLGTTWTQMAVPQIDFNSMDMDAAIDPATGEFAGFGISQYAQIMGYRDTMATTSAPMEEKALQVMRLGMASPNPARSIATIPLTLHVSDQVRIRLHDPLGLEISSQAFGFFERGDHILTIDVADLPNGVYFYTVTVGDLSLTRSMVVTR